MKVTKFSPLDLARIEQRCLREASHIRRKRKPEPQVHQYLYPDVNTTDDYAFLNDSTRKELGRFLTALSLVREVIDRL